jgi:CMP-N-acetylneuraminic acid synthetase
MTNKHIIKHNIPKLSKADKFKRVWVSSDELELIKIFRDELRMKKVAYAFARMAVHIAIGAAMLRTCNTKVRSKR